MLDETSPKPVTLIIVKRSLSDIASNIQFTRFSSIPGQRIKGLMLRASGTPY